MAMSAISSDRPVFPPATKGAGLSSAGQSSTVKILREAQAAFFRPAEHSAPAPEPVIQAAKLVAAEPPKDRTMMRPGSYLNILV